MNITTHPKNQAPSWTNTRYEDQISSSLKQRVAVRWEDGTEDSEEEVLAPLHMANHVFVEHEEEAIDRLKRLLQRRRNKSKL